MLNDAKQQGNGTWVNKHIKHYMMQPKAGDHVFEFRSVENEDGNYKSRVIRAANFEEACGELKMFHKKFVAAVCYKNGRFYTYL